MARIAVTLAILCSSGCVASNVSAQLEPGEAEDTLELSVWAETPNITVTDLAFLSDGRAVITYKSGQILVLTADGVPQNPQAARLVVDSDNEKGLLGVVRDDHDRLYLYVSDGNDSKDKHKVYRASVDANGYVSVDYSQSIIGHGLEGPANHDGGGMIIHEGQLYVAVGDTGFNASPPTNRYGTCLNKPNGKILRVNLDGSIPSDNPLVGMKEVTGCAEPRGDFEMLAPDERIYAWGLRNPWRFWIDPRTDLLWIGDVGEVTQEEITVGGKGAHHGWPFREGTVDHGALGGLGDCMDVVPASACVAPQHGYPRNDGVSVTGGLIPPDGCGWGDYAERYFFADFQSHQLWTIDVKPDRSGVVEGSRRKLASVEYAVSLRIGPDGAVYIPSFETGTIYRLTPKSVPASCGGTSRDGGKQLDSGAGDSGSSSNTGCGCNLATRRSSHIAWLAAALGLLVAVLRARGRVLKR